MRNASFEIAGPCGQLGCAAVATETPFVQENGVIAAFGLVHDVARDDERDTVVCEPVERRPEITAQHRVEPDGRLVEHEDVRTTDQRRSEGDFATVRRP